MNRLLLISLLCLAQTHAQDTACISPVIGQFRPLLHGDDSLVVDLGVGLYSLPVPWDYNGDGRTDLLVISGATCYEGFYCFENTGRRDEKTGMEIFAPAVRLGDGNRGPGNITPSYVQGRLRMLAPGLEFEDVLKNGLTKEVPLPVNKRIYTPSGRIRGNAWSYVDYDGDGRLDLVTGFGDWTDYGWSHAYDENGRWTAGPLHGFVYWLKNTGDNAKPVYAPAQKLQADGRDIDVFGNPSPQLADFRGTGKLDIICGEFLDGFTFFENIGTRTNPKYAPGRRLTHAGRPITMPAQMIQPVAYDWNKDGRMDLLVGEEDGRVAWMENTGRLIEIKDRSGRRVGEMPEFLPPRFFQQVADRVKFGCLTTPLCFDWDGDGLVDILSGNASGEIGFIKNLGGKTPRWARPEVLTAGGKPFRILAGYNGSIQGPAEAKWGYTNVGAGDWDGDGLPDIVINTIIGKVMWLRNVGTRRKPVLAAAQPVEVAWPGAPPKPDWNWWDPAPTELVVPWRTTACVIDLDKDGLSDLVSVDHEGYLAHFRQVMKDGRRVLLPGRRCLMLKTPAGVSPWLFGKGRNTFVLVDWDGDGRLDLLRNSSCANFCKNVSTKPDEWIFEDQGLLDRSVKQLSGHGSPPAAADWDGNAIPDLLLGAEDGFFYYLQHPRSR